MAKVKNTPKVLGLDVSTKTIGWALFDYATEELLELTHFSPKLKPIPESKTEQLLLKSESFILVKPSDLVFNELHIIKHVSAIKFL